MTEEEQKEFEHDKKFALMEKILLVTTASSAIIVAVYLSVCAFLFTEVKANAYVPVRKKCYSFSEYILCNIKDSDQGKKGQFEYKGFE